MDPFYDNENHYHLWGNLMRIYIQAALLGFCLITMISII